MKIKVLFRDILINFPIFLFGFVGMAQKTKQSQLWENKALHLFKFIILIYGFLVYGVLSGLGIWLITLPITLPFGNTPPLMDFIFSKYMGMLLLLYVVGLIFFIKTKDTNK